MTNGDQPSPRDSRFAIWIGATVGLFFLALAVGFVWLPSAQRGAEGLDLWSAICRAVGLPNGNAPVSPPVAGQPASTVAWTTETRRNLAQWQLQFGSRNCAALQWLPRHEWNKLRCDHSKSGGPERGGNLQATRRFQNQQARCRCDGGICFPAVGAGLARSCRTLCFAAQSGWRRPEPAKLFRHGRASPD